MVDDLGWRDLTYAGSDFYDTPNIDRLAASGLRFDQAYSASPVCSPSRAALLTGQSPVRFNMTTYIRDPGLTNPTILRPPETADQLSLSVTTLAERMKEAGYTTMLSGKWHLGVDEAHWPEHQGFDVNAGGCSLGNPNGLESGRYSSPYQNPRLTDGPTGEFLTDRLANETIGFIRQSRERPFFVMHSFYQVHTPITPVPWHMDKYNARAAGLPPSAAPRPLAFGVRQKARQDIPAYGSMVQAMDDAVGKILAEIDALGLASRTVIIFTSDNGGLSLTNPPFGTSNEPLRGGKAWLYEGGIRVPLIIRAPGVTTAGAHTAYPVTSEDIAPTILGLANVNDASARFDGENVMTADRSEPRDLYWHYPHYHGVGSRPMGAIRSGNWKLIEFFEDDRAELYDLSSDPEERNDLSATRADVVSQLRRKLADWRSATGARMPTRNP